MSYTDGLVKKAIEMHLHPNSFNGQEGFTLSQAGHPHNEITDTEKNTQREARLGVVVC
jgi:hypothetical protein